MKHPRHPRPSGDRAVARLIRTALRKGGHMAAVISNFSSYNGGGDNALQNRLELRAQNKQANLVDSAQRTAPPDIWFTYHLYHKAPDLLGPDICDALNIPYAVAEASRAPKQADGPWARGYAACETALARADAVFNMNPADAACVRPALRPGAALIDLPPFVDVQPFAKARAGRAAARKKLAQAHGLNPAEIWLMTAAMMRRGDKAASYAALARALADVDAPLLIAGDGPARAEVKAMFAGRAARTVFLGELRAKDMPDLYAACDLLVWPAVNEAYGMVFLESQAAGCPVVAGDAGGVAGVAGESGVLVPAGDAGAVHAAVTGLLAAPERLAAMRADAVRAVEPRLTITHAADILTQGLEQARAVRAAHNVQRASGGASGDAA